MITLADSKGTFSSSWGFGTPLSMEDPNPSLASMSLRPYLPLFLTACVGMLPLGYFATNAKL